jgi:signal transduction histidine kinase
MKDSPIRKFIERSVKNRKENDSVVVLPSEIDLKARDSSSLHSNNAMVLPSNLDESEFDNEKYIKIRIDIQDTGVGIKKENLSKLFMDFGKLDEHSKINAQGTGLGLSICKRMIEKMGGTVTVDSIEGEGTTFTVSLVLKAAIIPEEPVVELSIEISEKK